MGTKKRIAVILASHGEAETGGFIENYRVSLHTLSRASAVMPIPVPLQHLISFSASLKKRLHLAPGSAGSPQNLLTRAQADRLRHDLERHPLASHIEFDVHAAHMASDPSFEKVLAGTKAHDGQIVVPMAPVDNSLSCGQICRHISEIQAPERLHRVKVIGRLWTDEALYRSCLDHLFGGSVRLPEKSGVGKALVLMFHGTLVRDSKGNEPSFHTGRAETEAFAKALAGHIAADPRNPWNTILTAYLNHDVGGEWTTPSIDEVSLKIGTEGFGDVSLFAAGYFSDGNETIHRAERLSLLYPGIHVESIPCLNDSPVFAEYLATKVAVAATQILGFSGEDVRGDA